MTIGAPDGSARGAGREPTGLRAVVLGGSDVVRTIGQPGLLERTGAADVIHEPPTRLAVLLQRIRRPDAEIPADLPRQLEPWFASMMSTAATEDDVGLAVLSLRDELLGPDPRLHSATGLLLEPPADYEATWTKESLEWLERNCEPAPAAERGAAEASLREVIAALQTDTRTVLVLTVSTFDPADTTHSWRGVPDTYAVRAHRLIAAAQHLARSTGLCLVDIDGAVAELGGVAHVSQAGTFSDEAAAFITEEAIHAFDQAAIFGASAQPAVMRLAVPAFDRLTERGRITRWHVASETPVEKGDVLFDFRWENVRLQLDRDEADASKRRPTTGRRKVRERVMLSTVVAGSDGFLQEIVVGEDLPVAAGDSVAVVTPTRPDRAVSLEEAEGTFRVAIRRADHGESPSRPVDGEGGRA